MLTYIHELQQVKAKAEINQIFLSDFPRSADSLVDQLPVAYSNNCIDLVYWEKLGNETKMASNEFAEIKKLNV